MANVKLVFNGTEKSETTQVFMECYANIKNEIYIHIWDDNAFQFLCLDKETAIKFSRELRKQIALID